MRHASAGRAVRRPENASAARLNASTGEMSGSSGRRADRPRGPAGGRQHPVAQLRAAAGVGHDGSSSSWSSTVSSFASARRTRDFAVPSAMPIRRATSR